MKPAGFTRRQGAGRVPDPRRPAGQLRRSLPLPLEPAGLRGRAATASCSSTSTARPATARRSPTRSAATGAARRYDDLMMGLDAALAKYPWLDGNRDGRARRLVRRLHDQLDQRQDRSLQGAGLPRRQPRRAHGVLRHRGAVVPRVGARRHAVGEARGLHEAQPDRPREELEDADARRSTAASTTASSRRRAWRTFTALQRKGVPSRFLHFPDENHWVLKPQNSKLWHDEVLAWIDRWTRR